VNLQSHLWYALARVSAFSAWIVSATFACCTASLNHRSLGVHPCIMVSTWVVLGVVFTVVRCLRDSFRC